MPPVEISPERLERVKGARDVWIKRLIDLSRRNNLLYFRELQVGTLDLSGADGAAMAELMKSGTGPESSGVSLRRLVHPSRLIQASASLQRIAEKALSNFEERGLDTLFLALGLASWDSSDGGRPTSAPILLVPLKASRNGLSGDWSVRRIGDIQINHVLVHALDVEHAISLDPEALIRDVQGDEDGESFEAEPAFNGLSDVAGHLDGFSIDPRSVVGNFSFQKLAIVRDLKELVDALARNDIIAGIAGDAVAREGARGDRGEPNPREFDAIDPTQEFLVLDADSTQQKAIVATLRQQNGVISGPPGTGKSQTIANLIAEMAARGKAVLFVAEKRAALDVVLERLRKVDLGHLCLDLHGADVSRKLVARQLGESLAVVREALPPQTEDLHARFVERRDRLNGHVRRIHTPRPPSGLSVYQIYGRLLHVPNSAMSSLRFTGRELSGLSSAVVTTASEHLEEYATLGALITGDDPSPWTGAVFRDADAVRGALERARGLAHEAWPQCQESFARTSTECELRELRSVGELGEALQTISAINEVLLAWRGDIFKADLDLLCRQLFRGRTTARAWLASITSGEYRGARRLLMGFNRGGRIGGPAAFAVAENARRLLKEWRRWSKSGSPPEALEHATETARTFAVVLESLQSLFKAFPQRDLATAELLELAQWLNALARDVVTPSKLVRVHQLQEEIARVGLGRLLNELRKSRPAPNLWTEVLRYAWLSSCLEDAQVQDAAVSSFNGRAHDDISQEFCRLDRERLRAAVDRVRRAHAERVTEARNKFRDQSALVEREAAKKARHVPLRQMVATAPDVLLALRPCWMASPLSVSQLIPGDRPYFDVVIFDEASQVLPEDAVTSLLRGKQAVVAGDSRQLPPTTFFAAADLDDEEDDEAGGVAGFESILDVMSAFLDPPWSLDWHYRSRDEALIAFSNHHIYGDRLVTFPGAGQVAAITHSLVTPPIGQSGQEESASREVEKVVALIMEHARTRSHESLGVIAMGIKHADRISMALEQVRREHPESEEFFAANKRERFFVKNLERVQGDERDAIILTIGYGKDSSGRLLYRFGPLLQEGGERRLNVAITRARNRMTVVSSFTHHDMDPSRSRAKGVELLRHYLEYAISEGRTLNRLSGDDVPLNLFEQSIYDALTERGLQLLPQHGTSQYRIDLVAVHPERPGRNVLAIECDGATYHSAPTARDRDRLRQQHLEALGWRFHRIWSTDWFLRRDEEIERALRAFDGAVRHADQLDDQSALGHFEGDRANGVADDRQPSREVRRIGKPRAVPGLSIDQYSHQELAECVRWINSDGRLRTDDEIVTEVVRELQFARRGSRIVSAIRQAIRSARS
jgi:very-short-patch-repair endonuclease